MSDVEDYYQRRVWESDNLLYQVGKTVNGEVVGPEQIAYIEKSVEDALELSKGDRVADFGCGNGVLTNLFAPKVSSMKAFEISESLLRQARRYIKSKNVDFLNDDIVKVSKINLGINKAYSYEVVQHLGYIEVEKFVSQVIGQLPEGGIFFLGSIPDERRKWQFYDSKQRRTQLVEALMKTGSDAIGTWYIPEFFYALAEKCSVSCRVVDQNAGLYTSHYRFNCIFRV